MCSVIPRDAGLVYVYRDVERRHQHGVEQAPKRHRGRSGPYLLFRSGQVPGLPDRVAFLCPSIVPFPRSVLESHLLTLGGPLLRSLRWALGHGGGGHGLYSSMEEAV